MLRTEFANLNTQTKLLFNTMKNLRITVDGKVFDVNVEILGEQSAAASRPAAAPASVAGAAIAAPAAVL